MRILVIGGTRFVGRAFVEEVAKRGHELTLFHRGDSEPGGLPEVEHVHGDRNGGLDALRGRTWDAALDTFAYFPRAVRELGDVVGRAVGHYTLVSTLSVHPDEALVPGANEDAPLYEPPHPETEEVTGETYGPLKAASERAAQEAFAGRCLIVRPGYIVGPHDPTDRFTYYVRRAASGGEMLAPGPPDSPLQVVDVRDLGGFMAERVEAGDVNVYGVVGPGQPVTIGDAIQIARDLSGLDTKFTWTSEQFLLGLGDDVSRLFPMREPQYPGAHTYDASKAVRAGLRHRPFRETVADTLAWDRDRGEPELHAGPTREQERELLHRWSAGRT